jgi:hypothetical protein
MRNGIFWDIKTQFVLHRRTLHFLTEPSRLMLCKIWGFHGSDYEECRLLGYKNPVRTSQETHYVSATEVSLLMLCKIWGFHCGYYEEWRFLGYKNPVRTSQEIHCISVTEPSRLMLCKIWYFHGSDYEECRLLGRDAKNRNIPEDGILQLYFILYYICVQYDRVLCVANVECINVISNIRMFLGLICTPRRQHEYPLLLSGHAYSRPLSSDI